MIMRALLCGIGFIGCIYFLSLTIHYENKRFLLGLFLSVILVIVTLLIEHYYDSIPENVYKEKLNDIEKINEKLDRANKELQKFFIDHPEFKE